MRISRLIVGSVLQLLGVPVLFAASAGNTLLPQQFGGWQMTGAVQTSKDPFAADSVNAALLKEYGFQDFASATYTRDDGRNEAGRKLVIKAARFADATGAYGAFTYYLMPQMLREEIGDQGASLNERVLFCRGNVLVDATFARLTAMSAAELRDLAAALPSPAEDARKRPTLPDYLPAQSRVNNSIKYVIGPIGLAKVSASLPASLVDFNAGAEVALAAYNIEGREAQMMVISYPTPQIAAAHLRRMDTARQPSSGTNPAPLLEVGPFYDRRTGPIVVVAAGPLSQSEARSMLASVNYDADVTWNQNTYFDKKNNIANLLVNVIVLCGIIGGLAIVAGIAFGGIRVLLHRVFERGADRTSDETEFISLHLEQRASEPPVSR